MNNKILPLFLVALSLVFTGRAAAIGPTGDITLDGKVSLPDLLRGEQWVLGTRVLTGPEQYQGDVAPLVNGVPDPNGVLDTGDVVVLLKMIHYGLNFSWPRNQFSIGDSITEGEAADGTIFAPNHDAVWSTGYEDADVVNSFNERFEAAVPLNYFENNMERDPFFNHAESGAVMADFAGQAQEIINLPALLSGNKADLVTVFLGNNDVCASSNAEMTDPLLFEAQFRDGLDVLASSQATRQSQIHVSGIPAIYWLWNAKRSRLGCLLVWLFVPCQNLLESPGDDCVSSASRDDPDSIYPGDGENCVRRKEFHANIRDIYNPILNDVTTEYRDAGFLPNARYIDIFDIEFMADHVNNGDCFHPSKEGHKKLADEAWCRTHWGTNDGLCPN